MHEYEVGIVAGADGGYGLDVRPQGSTGSAPYLQFGSWAELTAFFASAGLTGDLLTQIEDIGQRLKQGSAYRSKMFLPEIINRFLPYAQNDGMRTLSVAKAAAA